MFVAQRHMRGGASGGRRRQGRLRQGRHAVGRAAAVAVESLEQRRLLSYSLIDTIVDSPAEQSSFAYTVQNTTLASSGDLIAIAHVNRTLDENGQLVETGSNPGSGVVRIYDTSAGAFVGAYTNPDANLYTGFAQSVTFVGDYIAVSANDTVFIYEGANDAAPTVLTNGNIDLGFGTTLSSVGDDLLVRGAVGGTDSVVVRYDLAASSSNNGVEVTEGITYAPGAGLQFGANMAASADGSRIAFAAGNGQVYEYDHNDTNNDVDPWVVYSSPDGPDANFGITGLAYAGNSLVVGTGVEKVYQYALDASTPYRTLGEQEPMSAFGTSVTVNDGKIFVSAPLSNLDLDTFTYSGVVYVYDAAGGSTNVTPVDSFDEPAHTALSHEFGTKLLSLADGRIAVLDQALDGAGAAFAGAIYVFAPDGVVAQPPVADAGADVTAVRSQTVMLDGSGSTADAGATIVAYDWDLNYDGVTFDVDTTGQTVDTSFATAGTYTVALRVIDSNGLESIDTVQVTITAAALVGGNLFVGGTGGAEQVTVTKATGGVNITLDGVTTFYAATGQINIFAGTGDDEIQVSGSLSQTVLIDGGAGNDSIKGGGGADILIGGAGEDLLVGGGGRDLLIGGNSADRVVGNAEDDILIAGYTAFDGDLAALSAILAEWTSDRSYADRVANLRGLGGAMPRLNGDFFLDASSPTVFDDNATDVLTGASGSDWFLFNETSSNGGAIDYATDLKSWEFSDDLVFIESDVV